MCPLAPFSVPLDLNNCYCDEDYVLYLGGRRVGDPIPKNVTTDVNPFNIEPWDSPENIWYLYLEAQQSTNGERGEIIDFRATENGFWRRVDTSKILIGDTVGWKITMEFYQGQAPAGTRTGWMMHEYYTEPTVEGVSSIQDYSSLCRIFWQKDQGSKSNFEQHNSPNLYAGWDSLESHMSARNEARESDEQSTGNSAENRLARCNFSSGDYLEMNDLLLPSERESNEKKSNNNNDNNNNSDEIPPYCDLSNGDYLELNDILSSDSASSSWGNSSRMSMTINSDEYFDPGELIREIEGGDVNHGLAEQGGEEHVEYRFSVFAPVRSDQVLISPSELGSLPACTSNMLVTEGTQDDSISIPNPRLESNDIGLNQDVGPTTSQSKKRNLSNSSSSSSSSGRSSGGNSGNVRRGIKSIGRIAKLSKKLFCFSSFSGKD